MAVTSHGMTHTPIYRLWWGMISRCTHPKTRGYENYGAKGIRVCPRWRKFANFYADMGDRPDGMTIDRVDNRRGYSPANCRWISNQEQQRNRSNNVYVRWEGRQWILADLCRHLGVYSTHVYRNKARGMTLVGALNHLVQLKEKRCRKAAQQN